MIDIKFDFDERKFAKEIQRGVEREALSQSKKVLNDLIGKSLFAVAHARSLTLEPRFFKRQVRHWSDVGRL